MPAFLRERVVHEMVRVTKLEGIIMIVEYAIPPKNARHSLLLRLTGRAEGEYFAEFVASDFRGLLNGMGIQIEKEVPVLMGIARITRGTNTKGTIRI